jgi:hypothetical protein
MRESIYRSIKFFNYTFDTYDSVGGSFDTVHYLELSLFILNTLVCIGGIAGYIFINKGIQILKLAVELANSEEVKDDFQFKDVNERLETKVKHRWTFHLVININMLTSMALCLYSVALLFLGVYIYEISLSSKEQFYNSSKKIFKLKNFSFISNGPLIDYCQNDKDLGILFNLTDYYNFYMHMMNYTQNIMYDMPS